MKAATPQGALADPESWERGQGDARWQRGPSVLGIRKSVCKDESKTGNLEIGSRGTTGTPLMKPESHEKIW